MKSFHLPTTTPKNWFKKINNVWYAKTHLGNTVGTNFIERLHYEKAKKRQEPIYRKAEVFLVSPELKIFIPVSNYDEHEDGKPLLTEIYKQYDINPLLFTVYRPCGINAPVTKEDSNKLFNVITTLKDDGYDLSKCTVYTGYLAENVLSPKITAIEYLEGKYKRDVVDIPLTEYGEKIKESFEKFRDIFSKKHRGRYNSEKMKTQLKNIYELLYPIGLIKEKEYFAALDIMDLYQDGEINDQKLEEHLFGFNGFRNTIHNRIRKNKENPEFIKKVGNPVLLSNLLSAM